MGRRAKLVIMYAPAVGRHVDAIEAKYHGLIRRAILQQLSFAPGDPTRNRKPLEDQPGPFGATWELRCGTRNEFRVFYEFSSDLREVWVLAIGVKDRDRLFIAGEEFEP
ncbi:MAG: addiction module toxin RelE [Planctomycetes bacterium]|nr:addiction module toxin RelE [Planctomycetota bacterium]